jgi:hypothetical protein
MLTNASMGIKIRRLGRVSELVVTANILVRLDEGGSATDHRRWWESATPSERAKADIVERSDTVIGSPFAECFYQREIKNVRNRAGIACMASAGAWLRI